MRPVTGLPRHAVAFGLVPIVLCGLLAPGPSYADDWALQSLSLRARVSEKTLLGKEAPEDFKEYDLSANVALPWERYSASGWGMGTRLMASAGALRGSGENALVVSLIPEWTLGSEDGRFLLDLGAGVALFSRHRFGEQDFGGPFQFALSLGVGAPLYRQLGIGYRFLHYSDAGVNGPDTTGADFHMVEFRYRF
ncbi:acyloxyacyl hydrolase [Halomonas beimenensis]|uniref:Uncharacterized protein n=1 Tax=Halomonas beimenensis TaxID=475662 RepID=A0A291P693_9GAMM|nr:acyloxyacyl hydrolase [Halomonas beimenensis]ATJ82388.1 hypothetical protein BEI_1401 [Halomonas beimenensis]